tara:strand:- start:146 stop:322 length:177 start_codon:yes stop_codon:yes gene_type:complete
MKDYTTTWVIGFVVFALIRNILPNLILNQEISLKKILVVSSCYGLALILRQELTERLL